MHTVFDDGRLPKETHAVIDEDPNIIVYVLCISVDHVIVLFLVVPAPYPSYLKFMGVLPVPSHQSSCSHTVRHPSLNWKLFMQLL
jgi:hypothetical protein